MSYIRLPHGRALMGCLMISTVILILTNHSQAQTCNMVSVTPAGNAPGNLDSGPAWMSQDGRWVVFSSGASNLVLNDTNNTEDIFLRDMQAGTTTRINLGPGGQQGDRYSNHASISDDGNMIAFASDTQFLVANDYNNSPDVFVYNRLNQSMILASVNDNNVAATGYTDNPQISRSGGYVVFQSRARDIVPGDPFNEFDVFVRDIHRGITVAASTNAGGHFMSQGATEGQVSSNGRFVALVSYSVLAHPTSSQGSDIFRKDLRKDHVITASTNAAGQPAASSGNTIGAKNGISDDGRFVLFTSTSSNFVPNDTNNDIDLFRKDTLTGDIIRVSLGDQGQQGMNAPVFGFFGSYSMSGDGRFVAFASIYPNLVSNDNNNTFDIFIRDTFLGTTTLISATAFGSTGNSMSGQPRISRDGRFIGFSSQASDLNSDVAGVIGLSSSYLFDRQETFGHAQHLFGGCHGSTDIPTMEVTPPVIGHSVTISGRNLEPSTPGMIFWSLPTTTPAAQFGACQLYLDLNHLHQFVAVATDANGVWGANFAIPNTQGIKGIEFNMQGLFLTANPAILALTDGVQITIGN